MREIRVWDKINKEMLTNIQYISFNPLSVNVRKVVCSEFSGEEFCAETEYVLNEGEFEIMEDTGLKDKNGKKIYAGDIVKGVVKAPQLLTTDTDENCNLHMGGYVFWDYVGFSIKVIESLCDEKREGMCNYFDFCMGYEGDFKDIEIVGHVYQNPELLNN